MIHARPRRILLHVPGLVGLVGLALLLAGCGHYRLGTPGALTFRTLYLPPVTNEALVPQAVALVSRELRSAFLRDGRVQLVESPESADTVLAVSLADYGRTATTALPDDTGRARKFDLTLEAEITLTRASSGERLLQRRVAVTRQLFTDGGQLPAEYQTLPLLAQQLADRVTHAVLDVW